MTRVDPGRPPDFDAARWTRRVTLVLASASTLLYLGQALGAVDPTAAGKAMLTATVAVAVHARFGW